MKPVILNLTPHKLNIYNGDALVATIPPSGKIARVETLPEMIGTLLLDGAEVPMFVTKAGRVTGLPEQKPGHIYIVSGMVRMAVPDRPDVWQPGELVRDQNGRVVGCRGLSR